MHLGRYRVNADWGHLAVAGSMGAFCLWYMIDTYQISSRMENVLLIVPMSLIGIVLVSTIAIREIKVVRCQDTELGKDVHRPQRWTQPSFWQLPGFMALLGAYVLTMPTLGFDLATFLFIVLGLAIQGERRWIVLIGFSLVFALAVSWAFKMMLTVSVPTRFW